MFGQGFKAKERHSLSQPKEKELTYSFPMLKSSEILQCMTELQIPLTEAEM
jgi:hypothetical protein